MHERSMTAGLVEGAHDGRGRGADFLTHLSKARCLALVVDLTGGREGALVGAPPAAQLEVLTVSVCRLSV
jgi:ribosome-binding ATPase YchF (GTP1/OBG family)